MSQRNHLDVNQNLFTHLPSEIIIDILSRLPIRAVVSCKCVCKSWLRLLKTNEFVKSHLSKAVPGLAVYQYNSKLQNFLEFEDGFDVEPFELHYYPVIKFSLSCRGWVHGSANGLLFLISWSTQAHSLHICNPITRDYIEVHCPWEFVHSFLQVVTYGFGVSKISGQHKVVRVFHDYVSDPESRGSLLRIPKPELECHVYTIGAGSWRKVAHVVPLLYVHDRDGAFVNGNLHWLMGCLNHSKPLISCFDLETELFSTFSAPPPFEGSMIFLVGLSALGDCLCLCNNDTSIDAIEIWLMKEYGVETSWTKEFVISRDFDVEYFHEIIYPIKVLKNGDILMELDRDLFYYSKEHNTTQKINLFEPRHDNAMLYTPSFLSLRSFDMENVSSF